MKKRVKKINYNRTVLYILGVLALLVLGLFYLGVFEGVGESPSSIGSSRIPACNQVIAPEGLGVVVNENKEVVKFSPPAGKSDGFVEPPAPRQPAPPEPEDGYCDPIFTGDSVFNYQLVCGRCKVRSIVIFGDYQDCEGDDRSYISSSLYNDWEEDIFQTDDGVFHCVPILTRESEIFSTVNTNVCDATCPCEGDPGYFDVSLNSPVVYSPMSRVVETTWAAGDHPNDRLVPTEECTTQTTETFSGPHCSGIDIPDPRPDGVIYMSYGNYFLLTITREGTSCESIEF